MIFTFFDYTLFIVMLGTGILGIVAGSLGSFALLKKQGLIGDAIAHAALPGIATMFLITQSKSIELLLLGGAISASIGIMLLKLITHKTGLKKDAALAIVLSTFFGSGLVLISFIQKKQLSGQAIINKFIFGNAATLLPNDIYIICAVGGAILLILFLFFKEFKLITFDPIYARTLGYNVIAFDTLLTFLMIITIIIGLQTVGVILMSSLLIAPAAAAYQWIKSLKMMILLSSFFGASACICGSLVSSAIAQLPTGPTIVVILSIFVILSMIFAPYFKNKGFK